MRKTPRERSGFVAGRHVRICTSREREETGGTSETSKPEESSVRHTRAIQGDRTKRPNTAPPDEQIQARLTELIHPATYAQVETFHAMGLRERILTLPVMMAFVLSLIWRHLGSVSEATRVL